jgi:2'-5' RNA ligase
MPMTDTLRLFIALELPHDVLAALQAMQDRLRGRAPRETIRWTRPEGIHLTLKFLGETPAAKQPAITAAMQQAAAGYAPLHLHAAGLGCFPNTTRPRVVWIGLGGDLAALTALAEAMEAATETLGFAREGRAFSPHLTLGRVRQEAGSADVKALGRLIEATHVGEIACWTAESVSLMRSDLRPDGARYTCLAQAPLKPVSPSAEPEP